MKSEKNAAFTLIELLVVVLIIGILAAVAVPQYQTAVRKTKYMSVLPLARSIVDAERQYYMANGVYTLDFDDLNIALPSQFSGTGAVQDDREGTNFILASNANGQGARVQFDAVAGDDIFMIWLFSGELRCYVSKGKENNLCLALGGRLNEGDFGNFDVYNLSF